MTFWVPIQATNTVEGRQYVRAVVNPTREHPRALERRDARPPASSATRLSRRHAPTGAPMARPRRHRVNLSTATRLLDAAERGAGRVLGRPVGTLGAVKVARPVAARDRHRAGPRSTPSSAAAGAGPDVDPLDDALAPTATSTGACGSARTAARRSTASTGSVACSELDSPTSRAGQRPVADGGDRGRYTVLPAAAPRFASVHPRATREVVLLHRRPRPLRQPRDQRATTSPSPRRRPGTYTPGQPYTLQRREVRRHAAGRDAQGPLQQPAQLRVAAGRAASSTSR